MQATGPDITQAMVVIDVVDSTGIRSRLGDSVAEQLRRRVDLVVEHAITKSGGSVGNWLGDGCEALFPSATAAIGAARDALAWVERDNGRAGRPERVSLRAAVEIGPAATLASVTHALAGACPPGSVLIGDRALRAAGSWGAWEGVVDTHGLRLDVSPPTFAQLIEPPRHLISDERPVARDPEISALEGELSRALGGEGRVVAVSGPAGIGKTTLVSWMAGRAHQAGMVVLGSPVAEQTGSPYSPLTAMLDRWISAIPEAAIRLGSRPDALTAISSRVPQAADGVVMGDVVADRQRLHRAIAGWFEEVSMASPTLMVLEDFQWAGPGLVEAIQSAAGSVRAGRILLLVTERRVAEDLRVRQLNPDVSLELDPLDPDASLELILRFAPDIDQAAAFRLAERAGGNPFYSVELARFHTADPAAAGVPDSLQQTVTDRVRSLGDAGLQVLQAASVIGDEFSLRAVRDMVDVGDALFDTLDAAVSIDVLRSGSDAASYRFSHQLVRSALYESVGRARRARLHELAGLALEQMEGTPGFKLAIHFGAAAPLGYGEKAAGYALAAARDAEEAFAVAEAIEWYERGLEFALARSRLRGELLVGWAAAARQVGREGWSSAIDEAVDIAELLGDGTLLGHAALAGYRGTFARALAVDERLVGRLRRAVALLGDDDLRLRCRLHAALGLELEWDPDPAMAREQSDLALELAGELADPVVTASVLSHRLWTLYHPSSLRVAATDQLLALTSDERRPLLAFEAHGAASFTATRQGDAAAVEEHLSHAIRLAQRIGVPLVEWMLLLRMFPWTLAMGRYAEATSIAEQTHALGRLTHNPDADQALQTELFWLAFDRRSSDESRSVMSMMIPFANKVRPIVWPSWAHVCAEAGMTDEVTELADMIRGSTLDLQRRDQLFLTRLYDMAVVAEWLGDVDLGRRLVDLIEPRTDLHANFIFATYGSMARAMGLALAAAGDRTGAVHWLATAAESNRASGLGAWEARALVDLARFDPPRRREHAERAGAIAESWGLQGLLGRARELVTE